ncbi:MAG: aspartate 1-decarboxylase, partial [Candidatus Omnitrophica bacterium]|nr:aspartate 1-decarboxylase [Candidatus Omnitrophota bacterium]
VHIANVTNGERLTTYAIKAPRGSRTIGANGAAAHLVREGDKVIIFCYGQYDEKDLEEYSPRLVFVNDQNDPIPGPRKEQHAQIL